MFTLTFNTDNAQFDGEGMADECARILHQVAHKIENGYTNGMALDRNGNRVGSWEIDAGSEIVRVED